MTIACFVESIPHIPPALSLYSGVYKDIAVRRCKIGDPLVLGRTAVLRVDLFAIQTENKANKMRSIYIWLGE